MAQDRLKIFIEDTKGNSYSLYKFLLKPMRENLLGLF